MQIACVAGLMKGMEGLAGNILRAMIVDLQMDLQAQIPRVLVGQNLNKKVVRNMSLGSAMVELLSANNDEDRKKASDNLVKEQDKLVREAAKEGTVVTFGNRGIRSESGPECE